MSLPSFAMAVLSVGFEYCYYAQLMPRMRARQIARETL